MQNTFITGDWGADRLRLFLCIDGEVTARLSGPGIAAVRGRVEATIRSMTAGWTMAHGPLPLLLCGMAGSTLGWREAPYLPCPATPAAISDHLLRFRAGKHDVAIAPGLACTNPLGVPDVMRGEETRILGAMTSIPGLSLGRQVICLPGAHSKWVLLKDGRIDHFQTAMTGELFETLRRHSILGQGTDGLEPDDGPAFTDGLIRGLGEQGATLPHLLFEARSRQLREGLGPVWALSFLSGLLIGQDCAGTLSRYRPAPGQPVTVIAPAFLGGCFTQALSHLGVASHVMDAEDQAVAGLLTLAEATFP
ncbi:2-dehydro-3-deoxygalactonokinase [Niveispirillum sp.]|uniref:2-dehydro-3-deoxygalactonokinase n=1 Tax=Niveispirillum sp. TaxID=1917217 RepID=UPI001B794EFC|nr:2-dehydro-3-deoxygalactonokinase [Niveispirillum sp.]MBP7340583.1 2-dehydro-3-deoxygalactonokinase [Niveispirillum sp.]